jgi:hypothetical protein
MTEIRAGKPEQGPFLSLDAVTLPGSGAYTDQEYTKIPAQARRLSIVAQYTLGTSGVNGQGVFRVQWKIPGENGPIEDAYECVIDGTDITKTGDTFLRNPEYVYEVAGPVVVTDPLLFRVLSLEVPVLAQACRVLVAELGDTAHPGKVSVWLYTSDDV